MHLSTLVAGAGVLWLMLASGNGFAADSGSLPEPRPLGRELPVVAPEEPNPEPTAATVTGELTLRQALSLALLHSPELTAISWEVRVKEAEALQAGLLPNPELGIEMENFAGVGEFSGTESAETTVTLSQLIELGGKRDKRRAASALEGNLAGWDFEARRLDVLTATAKSFIAVLASQERLVQADELSALADRFFRTVSERVEAGKVSPVEQTRAQVPLSTAHVAKNRARLELEAARKELVALWGDQTDTFERAVGSLESIASVPSEEQLVYLLEQNPDVARWKTEAQQRNARLALERAEAIPDLTLFAGGRNIQETGDNALVAGISIPLPLFDRNQGGIAAARAARSKAREEGRAAYNQAVTSLATSYRDLSAAFLEARTLQDQILPAAGQSFEAAELGYREGKFGFLEVLDAQRTLFEVKGQYIEALAAYHQARVEVERLIGASLETGIVNNEQEK
ncbi:MAG: TolC family protein [Desulfuromonadales bacterium]|nr:TolC family protein [Desulfuromonadales bacterium]